MKKVMFISSTGGHLSELLQLEPIFSKYNYRILTEKTKPNMYLKDKYSDKVDFVLFGNRHHFLRYFLVMPINAILIMYYLLKFRPETLITTGAHTCIFPCLLAKLFGKQIIYIETFANLESKTMTGRMMYYIADTFIVQWKSMLKLYPKAKYLGWIY